MGFPYAIEEDFELGTLGNFDSETDTESALDYPSYKTLAGLGMEPYSGAYCMRLVSGLGTAEAWVKAAIINIANTETRWFRMNILFSNDFTSTADDASVMLLELEGAGPATTASFGYKLTTSGDIINLGIGSTNTGAVPATFSTQPVERGVWYTVELKVVIQTGGTGTMDMYVTKDGGVQATAAEASLDTKTNIAVTDGYLGFQGHATAATGSILIDNFAMSADTAQLFRNQRYPETRVMTKTGHAFVGPGKIESVTLLAGNGTDGVCKIYDSDVAAAVDLVGELGAGVALETVLSEESYSVRNGAYVVLSGTAPRALVKIAYAPYSAGVVRALGRGR